MECHNGRQEQRRSPIYALGPCKVQSAERRPRRVFYRRGSGFASGDMTCKKSDCCPQQDISNQERARTFTNITTRMCQTGSYVTIALPSIPAKKVGRTNCQPTRSAVLLSYISHQGDPSFDSAQSPREF